MSAQLNTFTASLQLAYGASATVTAPDLATLAEVVGRLRGDSVAANDTNTFSKPGDPVTAQQLAKADAGKASPARSPTPAPASAPAAASGSEGGAEAPRFTYDDVKDRVLKLAKEKGREVAAATLGAFKTVGGDKVDHGNKLQLQDYPAFIAEADKLLGVAA